MTEAELIYQFFVYYTNPWFFWICGITLFLKLLDRSVNKYPQRPFRLTKIEQRKDQMQARNCQLKSEL